MAFEVMKTSYIRIWQMLEENARRDIKPGQRDVVEVRLCYLWPA
jgi:hypothetical protein